MKQEGRERPVHKLDVQKPSRKSPFFLRSGNGSNLTRPHQPCATTELFDVDLTLQLSISQQAASPPGQDGTSCKIRILPSSQPALRQLEIEARGPFCLKRATTNYGRVEGRGIQIVGVTRTHWSVCPLKGEVSLLISSTNKHPVPFCFSIVDLFSDKEDPVQKSIFPCCSMSSEVTRELFISRQRHCFAYRHRPLPRLRFFLIPLWALMLTRALALK